ncbi:MAG: hypothetical protein KGV50_07555 [Gammaproteobacteria bacterium]|nr:hypothetical protein [Gammaproteobacteria bacterium]
MKKNVSKKIPKQLLHPKYWGVWLVLGILFVLIKILPYSWLMRIGSGLGIFMEKVMPYRALVAKTNIRLCFEQSNKNWQTIYKKYVKSLGKGVFEMSMSWFLSHKAFDGKVHHKGFEYVEQAKAEGRGVLFLGVHTTSLDFGAPLLASRYSVYFMYKAARNPVLDYIITQGRLKHCPGGIRHDNLREVLNRLKKGQNVWYGCDQDFGHWSSSVFAPFFGISALTLPYYAKIAKKTGAAVIPVAGFRDEENNAFEVRYLPEIDVSNLNDEDAAKAMNSNIEQLLEGFEEQYYWIHRRFKTRPEGEEDVYPPKPSQLRRQRKKARKAKQ